MAATADLDDAVDALIAYDHGATDSGIGSDEHRESVRSRLLALGDGLGGWADGYCRRYYLSAGAKALGYGESDAEAFREWLHELVTRRLA